MENIIFWKHTSGILVITIAQPEIKVSNNEKKKILHCRNILQIPIANS